ncbi:MAG: response regulator, partial [Desulfosarcina sp.]
MPPFSEDRDKFSLLRQKAEVLLDHQPEAITAIGGDILDLIQELRVYQAEVEIQNEELRRAQEALTGLHAEYVDLYYDFAPCGYVTLNLKGFITRVNLTAVKLLGLDKKGLLTTAFSSFVAPSSEADYFAMRKRLNETAGAQHVDLQLKRKNGRIGWVRLDIQPDLDADGHLFQSRMTLVDISEARKTDEALRKSENLYHSLAVSLPGGAAFVVDRQLRYLLAEGEALRKAGLRPDGLVGKTIHEALDPEMASLYEPFYRSALDGHPFRIEHASHGRHYFTRGTPLSNDRGEVYAVLAVSTDISERKQSEQALRHLNQTLEQRVIERTAELESRTHQLRRLSLELSDAENRERERIAQLLHDEFQQDLAAIKLKLDILLGGDLTPQADLEINQCIALIRETIDKTRGLSTELSPPALRRGGLLAGLELLAKEMRAKHELEVKLSKQPAAEPHSRSLTGFLYQATRELLFNVVKHAGVKCVEVDASVRDNWLLLRVTDAGGGRDREAVSLGMRQGQGFGLFSIEERIQALGGRMTIDTAPGTGWTTTLTVPRDIRPLSPNRKRANPAPADVSDEAREFHPDREAAVPGTCRILITDDHHLMRDGLARLLDAQPGIQVVGHAADGREAVDLTRQLRPDVVLMDVAMPQMDGIEATARIHEENPDIVIIGLSMFEDSITRRSMLEAGAVDFVCKS